MLNLSGVKFKWKVSNKSDIGLIAQDVEKVVPEVVYTDENGYKSVDYSKLVPLLIESIKAQDLRLRKLEERCLLLEEKLNSSIQ